MSDNTNVGQLRQASALCSADTPVEIAPSPEMRELLGDRKLVVRAVYPNTMNAAGEWEGTFVVRVALEGEKW